MKSTVGIVKNKRPTINNSPPTRRAVGTIAGVSNRDFEKVSLVTSSGR